MRITLAVIVSLLLISTPAAAEPMAPPFKSDGSTPARTLRKPPSVNLRLGSLLIQFERTTLHDIQRAVGSGQIAHRGDAGDSTYWLCYEGKANSNPVRLWLIAGEIDGPEHTISVIQLQDALPGSALSADCPLLPPRLQPINLGRAALLGFKSAAAVAKLGEPSSKATEALTYFYLGKVPGTYEGKPAEFDRINFLELRLSAGKVVGIVASQSTTY